jgi:hypothetical protein
MATIGWRACRRISAMITTENTERRTSSVSVSADSRATLIDTALTPKIAALVSSAAVVGDGFTPGRD